MHRDFRDICKAGRSSSHSRVEGVRAVLPTFQPLDLESVLLFSTHAALMVAPIPSGIATASFGNYNSAAEQKALTYTAVCVVNSSPPGGIQLPERLK